MRRLYTFIWSYKHLFYFFFNNRDQIIKKNECFQKKKKKNYSKYKACDAKSKEN